MKQYSKTIEAILVAFHTGRGGRFHNAGHKVFIGQDTPINDYTDGLFIGFENSRRVGKEIGDRENLKEMMQEAEQGNYQYNRLLSLGLDLGKQVFCDGNGNPVGLDCDNDGTGEIKIDGEYDTTEVMLLKDCSQEELQMILDSNEYVSDDVIKYCDENLK